MLINNIDRLYEIEIDPEILEELQPYSFEEGDSLEDILNAKEILIKRTIKEFSKLIQERQRLNHKVVSDLTTEILRTHNVVLGSRLGPYQLNIKDESKNANLDGSINKLEVARVTEYVQAWQDVMQLKKEIVELMNKLIDIKTKKKLFKEK